MEGQQDNGSGLGGGIILGGLLAQHHHSVGETLREFSENRRENAQAGMLQRHLAQLNAEMFELRRQNAVLQGNYNNLAAWAKTATRILANNGLLEI